MNESQEIIPGLNADTSSSCLKKISNGFRLSSVSNYDWENVHICSKTIILSIMSWQTVFLIVFRVFDNTSKLRAIFEN